MPVAKLITCASQQSLELLLPVREKVGELLSQVCSGVGTQEMGAALQGLLAAAAHVRAAAITALLDVPAFAEGTVPHFPLCDSLSRLYVL